MRQLEASQAEKTAAFNVLRNPFRDAFVIGRVKDAIIEYSESPLVSDLKRVRFLACTRENAAGETPAAQRMPRQLFGIITESITWMTPFEVSMSVLVTLAALTITPLVALTSMLWP